MLKKVRRQRKKVSPIAMGGDLEGVKMPLSIAAAAGYVEVNQIGANIEPNTRDVCALARGRRRFYAITALLEASYNEPGEQIHQDAGHDTGASHQNADKPLQGSQLLLDAVNSRVQFTHFGIQVRNVIFQLDAQLV